MLISAKAVIKIHVHNTLLRLVSLAQLSVIKLTLPIVSVLHLLYITLFKNRIFNYIFYFLYAWQYFVQSLCMDDSIKLHDLLFP